MKTQAEAGCGAARATQRWTRQGGPSPESPEGAQPQDTPISDFWLQTERKHVVLFKELVSFY